jgi:hypothetical protein
MNATVAQSKNFPFGVNTAIWLKDKETASRKNGIWLVVFQLTSVPVLPDAFVAFSSSIVALTPNGQFLDCATVTFSE